MPELFLPGPFLARRRRGPPENPLAPFYGTGEGQVPLHISTAGVTPPGGPATAVVNAGGAGAALDAVVSGAAMVVDGAFLTTGAASGFPILAAPVDLFAGRLIWVMNQVGLVNLARFMGHTGAEIRANLTEQGLTLQLWSDATGSGVTVNPGTRVPAGDGPLLCEVGISGTTGRFFIDGASLGTAPVAWETFPISRIGRGTGSATPVEGGATVAAVRAAMNDRFGLGLTL